MMEQQYKLVAIKPSLSRHQGSSISNTMFPDTGKQMKTLQKEQSRINPRLEKEMVLSANKEKNPRTIMVFWY